MDRLVGDLASGTDFLVSPVVYYEIRRGLLKVGALRELNQLEGFITKLTWIEVTRGDWEEAASLWAMVHRAGRPRADADLLIAAQANRRGAIVATGNVRHFKDIASKSEKW